MLFGSVKMLKKKLGIEFIESERRYPCRYYYKIPSTLIIPEGCVKVGAKAFWCCRELKRVVISGSVVEIGKWAFRGCDKLEKVVIPGSVKEIMEEAFEYCWSATIILKKPKSKFKYIGPFAFNECKDVKEETRT